MINKSSSNSDPGPDNPEAGEGSSNGNGQRPEDTGDSNRTVHDVIEALQAESAEFKDKWLRAQAEIENVRKRAEREREDTAKYAISKIAHDIVNVGDNFQRAIEAVPAAAADQDAALKSVLDGVRMIERELLNALERFGIKRMQPINELFNPHLHQAVMEVPRADVPSGLVVQVFQPGYTIEDRVLRPAMVGVAKGGPKAAAGETQGPPREDENVTPD
jgi:molecular chaperone GrpE